MKHTLQILILVLLLGSVSCTSHRADLKSENSPDTTGLHQQRFTELFLDSAALFTFVDSHPEAVEHSTDLYEFYRMRNFRFAWFNKDGVSERAGHFINMLRAAEEEVPRGYFITFPLLQSFFDSVQVRSVQFQGADSLTKEFEMMLTAAYFNYARRMYSGLGEESFKTLEWYIPRKKISYPALLDSILQHPLDSNSAILPVFHMYIELRKELVRYSSLLKSAEWGTIPYPKKELKSGENMEPVKLVKERLYYLGDLQENDRNDVFTKECENAVKRFQERMGLKVEGRIDRVFIDALNVPLESRIRTLLLNMERCRWLPFGTAGKFIVINLPEFRMHVFDSARMQWSANVIIGKAGLNTVIFTGNLKYVVFSPYWNVPNSIFENEMLPEIRKDISYLGSHNLEIVKRSTMSETVDPAIIDWSKYPETKFPYLLRQRPGPDNSLGLVKFLFPNTYSMYLHDTPNKNLFKEPKRDFSHGCIRVEEPFKLAEFLLSNDSAWIPDSIEAAMHSGKEKFVVLREIVPVIIVYFTAWIDEEGRLNFRDDIYGHDRKLEHVLFSDEQAFF